VITGEQQRVGVRPRFLLAVWTLWVRDMVRFVRQRSRIVGALGSPIVFWFVIGSGLGRSFQSSRGAAAAGGYLEYFFPGTLALIVLFTAIFSTISVIEDRQEGFLQGVLVAPVPRSAIVLGKILGGASLAVAQACVFLALAPLAHVPLSPFNLVPIVAVLIMIALALTGLGFLIAWSLDSTQGFHAIMNLFLVPMWLLSGSLFPESGASGWVRVLMVINPLTYGVDALRAVLYQHESGAQGLTTSIGVTLLFALSMILGSTLAVRRPLRG
jgi:ABC-2 type transport system permease protein